MSPHRSPRDTSRDARCDVSLDVLAARAGDGDEGAVEQALAVIRPAVVRYLLAQRLTAFDVEDLAQDVCITMAKSLRTWTDRRAGSGGEGPVWQFVFTVVRRRVVDRQREAARDRTTGEDGLDVLVDQTPGPEELVVDADGYEQLRRHLAHLSASHRDVLLLRIVVGLDVTETAQALGLARGSVHVLQHRALKALRARFADEALTGVGS